MRDPNPLSHRYLRFWRSDPRADLEDELAFHVQARVDEYVAAGMDVDEARAEAERRLGDLKRVRTECLTIDHELDRRQSMSDVVHGALADLRVALRQLRRQRVLTAAAVLCLALGIGANTAIFSVVDALLLHPLALPRIDRVMAVWETARGSANRNEISAANYLDFRARSRSFTDLAAYTGWNGNFTEGNSPERVQGYRVTPNFFPAISLLARGTARRRELALRAALGASRSRLVRALLAESVVLGVAGALAGVLLAYWGVHLIRAMTPAELTRFVAGWDGIGIDGRVLGFTVALSITTVLIFGLVPALRAARVDLHEPLGDGAERATEGRLHQHGRRMLVAAEVALTLLLLVSAGLMVRSLRHLYAVDPGFRPEGVATMIVAIPQAKYPDSARTVAFFRDAVQRIGAIPGVSDAGASSIVPFCGCNSTTGFRVEGEAPFATGSEPDVGYREITPGYLHTLRIPVRTGRDITEHDDARSVPVIIVNEAFAKQYAGGQARGRQMMVSGETKPREIVGVVGNVLHDGPGAVAKPEIYIPHAQDPVHEIGIRMALGADRGAVLRMVIRQGMAPALLGLAIGAVLALIAMRGLSVLLYGVDSTDPTTYFATAALLAGVALVASWLPARSAARVDPVLAMRGQDGVRS